jgi:2-(1,2-epoxy-1,2-dihydrophenyl)acetyl-CoA isomerase
MTYETILFEVDKAVARITLNRPDAANGLTLTMCQELHDAAVRCDHDPAIRAVLLTGTGRMFCAGGDIKFFQEAGEDVGAIVSRMTLALHGAVSVFNRMDAPVVVAVNGTAAGGGLSLAISGDFVMAAESAKFTLAYTAAALSPDGSSSWFLPRLVGLRRAKELMLTNRVLTAREAADYGMIDRVVADEDLPERALRQAEQFATGPTGAYGAVKRLLAGSFEESLETQMANEARHIAERLQSPDGREGVAAFIDKRAPKFTGH